jgi:hypothetical protein
MSVVGPPKLLVREIDELAAVCFEAEVLPTGGLLAGRAIVGCTFLR